MHINPPKAEHWTVKVVSWLKIKELHCKKHWLKFNGL